jgi:hypothetical protein
MDEIPQIIVELQRENATIKFKEKIMVKALDWLLDY